VDSLSKILLKQAGFDVDENNTVLVDENPCTLQAELLIQLTLAWCLEKNRRYLFSHQSSQQILKDFEIEPDPQLDKPSKL
jgi:hypothetical protein